MNKIVPMYAFFDKRSKTFDTPFFSMSDLFAERHFRQLVMSQKESMIKMFKGDFILYKLGTVDNETGEFIPEKSIVLDGNQFNEKENE